MSKSIALGLLGVGAILLAIRRLVLNRYRNGHNYTDFTQPSPS